MQQPRENGKETKGIGRRNVVPIIHVKGTYYDIGFDIVSSLHFSSI